MMWRLFHVTRVTFSNIAHPPRADTFEGVVAFLHAVGAEHNMLKRYPKNYLCSFYLFFSRAPRRQIVGFGGALAGAADAVNVTHVLTGLDAADEQLARIHSLRPQLPVLHLRWVRLSVERGSLLDTADERVRVTGL